MDMEKEHICYHLYSGVPYVLLCLMVAIGGCGVILCWYTGGMSTAIVVWLWEVLVFAALAFVLGLFLGYTFGRMKCQTMSLRLEHGESAEKRL